MPSVIALDAMGSDRAPKPEIEGAILAARQYGMRVLLVGPETVVKAELDRHSAAARLPIEVVHASEFITMEDKVEAIRAKRDSSMRVGLRMVREGQAARASSPPATRARPWPRRKSCWAPYRAWIVRHWPRCSRPHPAIPRCCSTSAPMSIARPRIWNSLR